MHRKRKWGSFFSGWALMLAMVGYSVSIDPAAWFSDPSPWAEDPSFWVKASVVQSVASFLAYSVFSRPYYRVSEGCLHVQNPFTRWSAPLDMIQGVQSGLYYPKVDLGVKRLRVIAAEETPWDFHRGNPGIGDVIAAPGVEGDSAPPCACTFARTWGLNGVQVGIIIFWIAFFVVIAVSAK